MSVVDEIKARIDIVDFVRDYLPSLRAAGSNFKALCPFHAEKTPSFMVSQEKQIFKCFGCGEGGSVFDFFMKMEGAEFPEALRALAQRAGVVLKREDPKLQNRKTRLYDLCEEAANFFEDELIKTPPSVRDYLLNKRGLTAATLKQFRVGFAPEGWRNLTEAMEKKGFRREELVLSGLALEKDGKIYDRFRGRIMFPIEDHHKAVAGFTGRLLPEDEASTDAGKYVNTPSTLIYEKAKILYGLSLARQEIRKRGYAILAEGQMDVLALHQLGFPCAVASSGTALTRDQLNLLKRYTSSIVLAFDADEAGQQAALRGIEAALEAGFEVKIFLLPEGIKDPADCLKIENGAVLFQNSVREARSILAYLFEKNLRVHDPSSVEGKKAILKEFLSLLAKIENRVEADFWIKKLAQTLDVSEAVLRESIPKKTTRPGKTLEPTLVGKGERTALLSEKLFALITRFPAFLPEVIDQLLPEYLEPLEVREWYKRLVVSFTEKRTLDFLPEFFAQEPLAVHFDLLADKEFSEEEGFNEQAARPEIIHLIKLLKRDFLSRELKEIEKKIQEREQKGVSQTKDEMDQLLKEFNRLAEQLKVLS